MSPPLCIKLVRRRRTVEVQGIPYVLGENSSMYDEHDRLLTTLANTQHQVHVAAVAEGRNF